VVATDLGGTNELRFSADGTQLYVAETGADHITRFRVGADATLTDREIYGPERVGGAPDGFAFDAHGNLWTTLIGQDKLVAITPEGEVQTLWEDGDRAVKAAARSSAQDSGAGTTLGAKPGDGLAPRMASMDALVLGEDDELAEEGPHRLQAPRAPVADEGPLGQFAVGHEGDRDGVASELPGEGVRGAAAQERGGDVGVGDEEAHTRPARREA
jgi:hypothetical protein